MDRILIGVTFIADISVSQWLGLTPPQVVKDTLHLPDELVARLPKYKTYIVPGHTNLTDPNYGP